ncbi:MAG: hypothetical protein SNJ70_07390, partial [Armatimonadota bacterium]
MAKSEKIWVAFISLLAAVLSSLPYIIALIIQPDGYKFMGFTRNIDDAAVYLSWIAQAADGNFFITNLFTLEPQNPKQFNIFFLIMGFIQKITSFSPAVVFHIFRLLLIFAFVFTAYKFSKLFLNKPSYRKLFIVIICFSSGLGWLINYGVAGIGSVDLWQPEAITFLSMYLNPLFLISLILMIAVFYFLLKFEDEKNLLFAVKSGICLLLLSNIHTYDVVTIAFVWTIYVITSCIIDRQIKSYLILGSFIAALIALPGVGYQYYSIISDAVLYARANTPAFSPPILSYFIGYGLVLFFALITSFIVFKDGLFNAKQVSDSEQLPLTNNMFLIIWSVVGFM